jgi:putative ABC transport system permease protein
MIPIRYNVRSMVVRKATTIATGLGIALVVYVLASALMLSTGVKKTLATSGRDDTAIVLRKGSDNEMSSTIEDPHVNMILAKAGVARQNGAPLGAGEVIVVAAMEKVGVPGVTNVQIRGVGANVMEFRPTVKVTEGRPARPGSDEVIVGKRIRGRFKGVDLGQSFELRKNRPVTVVGVFEDNGSSHESEVWVDLDTLRTSFGREGIVSSVRARLESTAAFDGFKADVEQDKRLGFTALREKDFYEKQSEGTSMFIGGLGAMVSVFFAVGAMIGAMITMYAAVANRQREIGTLRALGFSRGGILFSFLLESVILAVAGGTIGTIGALLMGFVRFSMMNMASWSEMVFTFEPTGSVIVTALIFSVGMGLLGGFFPALRASRVSPIAAMRA